MALAEDPEQRPSATAGSRGNPDQPHGRTPTDGSLTSHNPSTQHPLAELLECTEDFAHARNLSRIKQELSNGCYKIASGKLAERLLKIAGRATQ